MGQPSGHHVAARGRKDKVRSQKQKRRSGRLAGQVCCVCLAQPPVHDRARAALIDGEASRDLMLRLKYQGRRDGLAVPGGWMANAGPAGCVKLT